MKPNHCVVLTKVFLLFGSNIEPRFTYLAKAATEVSNSIGKIVQLSSVYESEAWGFQTNDAFLNQVVLVETNLSARKVLDKILMIEDKMGRTRSNNGYSSREIDIDILYFGEQIIFEEGLVVPHPKIQERRFVLFPLVEIAASLNHPVLNQTNSELLEHCNDGLKVWKFKV